MKKKIIIILTIILIISGCQKKSDRREVLLAKYKSAYDELLANDKFIEKSEYYDIEVVVNKTKDQKYRVDLIIDKPRIAMYNILALMEINSIGVADFDEINPSLGLVDESKYNLIPSQVNKKANYYEGLVLSGISDKSEGEVIVMITWSDYAETNHFNEFIKLSYGVMAEVEVDDNANEEVGDDE